MLVTFVQFYCHCSCNASLAIFPGKRTSNDMKGKKRNRKYPSKWARLWTSEGKIMQLVSPPPSPQICSRLTQHSLVPLFLPTTKSPPSAILVPSKKHKYQPSSHPDSTQWWDLNKKHNGQQTRKESHGAAHSLCLGLLPHQRSLGPWLCNQSKHRCTTHITSVCFCILSLKIACLWAESAPNFSICFEPTSAHSFCRLSCFAWNLTESEPGRRKRFFPPTVLACFLLSVGARLLTVLFCAFLFFQWTFGACPTLSLGSVLGSV